MSTEQVTSVLAQRWLGVKMAAGGMAMCGIAFAAMWFLEFKPAIALFVLGWIVGVAGSIIHVRQMLRESRLKQSELHPRAAQPWEKQ